MAISPPSDIVLDVVRAADQIEKKSAIDRLTELKPDKVQSVERFETLIRQNGPRNLGSVTPNLLLEGAARQTHSQLDPYQKFEAFVLQTFVQEMLPDDAESVFGGGTAGDIWKSLLAEQLSGQIAKNGGIGIAKEIGAGAKTATSTTNPALHVQLPKSKKG